jgi:AbiV family abortive infection protein
MTMPNAIENNRIAAMAACVKHARALLESAQAVQAAGHSNIAYHLALLALEELGRRELLGIQSIANKSVVPPAWTQKHTQDHTKKLFWCFFGANFISGPFTKEHFEQMQEFARQLHERRLAGLYVDYENDSIGIPADAVGEKQASSLIGLAAARLGMAEAERLRTDIPQEELERQAWFLAACDDPEKQRVIFTLQSLSKLTELKDAGKWVEWLKEEFSRAETTGRNLLEQELLRSRELPELKTKDKWKIRIRIISQSHSIRPKLLTAWNSKVDWIKLFPVNGKKDQLLIEFILGDNLPVESLWYFGWGLARHFVAALNIGTMGFWWWYMPEHIDRYYESMEDLERKQAIRLARSPSLKIDWGANRVLTDADLGRVSACFATIPGPSQQDKHLPYGYYLSGLTLLAANNVHWQCETMAFGNFYHCLRGLTEQAGQWTEGAPYAPVVLRFLDELFPSFDERARFESIFEAFERESPGDAKITLREVSSMKLFCDSFFLAKFMKPALDKATAGGE